MNRPAQPLSAQTPVQTDVPRYFGHPPHFAGDMAFGIEKFSDMVDEIRPLHEIHYNETETSYLDEAFNPNYEQYIALERDGRFICFTCRTGLKMVGYLQYYVYRSSHTQRACQAREDAFFLHPLIRGKKIAPIMLAYAEDALRVLGCHYIGMTSKAPVGAPDIGPFLQKRGYKPVAVYYAKKLER